MHSPHTRPTRRSSLLSIEVLEDRCVPATLTVTTAVDENVDNNVLSLREAILAINNGAFNAGGNNQTQGALLAGTVDLTEGFGVNDRIIFDDGTINADLSGATIQIGADNGLNSQMVLSNAVDIDASTLTGGITIDAEDDNRIFNFNSGVPAQFTLTNLTLTQGSEYNGGAVYINDANSVTLQDSTVSDSNATGSGGGVFIHYGSLTISNTTISGNQAVMYGSGLDSYHGTIVANDSRIINNINSENGGGIAAVGSEVTVQNTLISGNTSEDGGGIYSVYGTNTTVINSTITDNTVSYYGGGISSYYANLTVINSTISNNVGTGPGTLGGGIGSGFGNLVITNSTISGNMADVGGGIYTYGTGNTHVINSTISANTAYTNGGGFALSENSNLTVTNSTITQNIATTNGGGIYTGANSGTLTINNSILAGNSATALGNDLFDTGDGTTSGTNNLFTTDGVVGTNAFDSNSLFVNNVDDVLDPTLADNGGPTLTHALLENSVAINAGDNAVAVDENDATLTADQRGFSPRIANGTVDIGAVEFDAFISGIFSSDVGPETFQAFHVTITGNNVTLDDIDITGGVARQLVDNGDGTYTLIIAPNSIGAVMVSAPTIGDGGLITTFDSLSFGSANEDFVRNLYTVIYARTATEAEVEFWTTQMASGALRTDVLAGFLASDEYTGMFADNASLIDGIYQLLFRRDADTDFWDDQLNEGASILEVVAGILSSEEYFDRLVRETYNEFLLRPIDELGLAFWVDELLAGNLNSDALRAEIANSPEAMSV